MLVDRGGGSIQQCRRVAERGEKAPAKFATIFQFLRELVSMKIYKMLVDKKPDWCLLCPLMSCGVKIEMDNCGEKRTVDIEDGWTRTGKVPDDRCLLEEV